MLNMRSWEMQVTLNILPTLMNTHLCIDTFGFLLISHILHNFKNISISCAIIV